jgi:hypothetical protein
MDDWRTFKTTDRRRKSTLCLRWHVNDLPLPLAKSMPDQVGESRSLGAKNGRRQLFSGEIEK